MRYGVALALPIGLLIAVPAAARHYDETVRVRVGQTVPLKTVFDKKKTYTIVMSGLITRTLNATGATVWYDPFHGAQGVSCQNPGVSVYLQIEDAHGGVIEAADAYKPPVYTIPCRLDHRYTFTINDNYPPVWDLDGKAKAYITLQEAEGWTTNGSFRLEIRSESSRRDAEFTVRAKKEISASDGEPLLADVRLSGSGKVADLDGDREGRGRLLLTVVWLTRDDTELTLQPTGTWRYNRTQRSVGGSLRVVKSNVRACRNRQLAITLGTPKNKRAYVRIADPSGCSGGKLVAWLEPESEIDLTVEEVERN